MPLTMSAARDYLLGVGEDELERLRFQHDVWRPVTSGFLDRVGVPRGAACLDVGAGPGFVSADLCERVGPTGHVTVWEPKQFYSQKVYDQYQAVQAKLPNVWMRVSPFEAPDLPAGKYDFMLINLDYHDVYWESAKYGITRMDPDEWLKTIYAAMKPGAIVGVVDHVASPGDTRATVEKLHRIDPETVKADFKRAGFQLVGTSNMLRNPEDDHSLLVFDPKIRGKTDRFVLKFRKPR